MASPSLKEIYKAGLAVAEVLEGWKQTGFFMSTTDMDIYTLSKRAISVSSEIVPGEALNYTLQIAEYFLGDKDGMILENYCRSNINLVDIIRTEYVETALTRLS